MDILTRGGKVWIKANGEMPFLYGNHVLKAHLGRITEDTPEHQGVVVFNMSDVPLVLYCFLGGLVMSTDPTIRDSV
jgi:ribosome biogenesis protein Nip4